MTEQIALIDLVRALERDEFVYYYQPKVSFISGRLSGAEALLRWVKPDGQVIGPAEFIPLAEASGYITEIALAMFPKLTADMGIINDLAPELKTSFNLTGMDFESRDMLDAIASAIARRRIAAESLQVELTEASVIKSDNLAVRRNLAALVELGVSLAMDDYGTGYSSIETLSHWPFDVVKIDKGLIGRVNSSEKSRTIVQASIRMAHQLGIRVLGEGIESAAVYDFLLHTGCTEAQGFWIARPMPLEAYLAFVKEDHRWSGMPTGLIHMAVLDHVQWRQALIAQVSTHLLGGHETPAECEHLSPIELDHRRCKLGRWYYGQGQEFRGHPLFEAIEEPHARLHALAEHLLEMTRTGAGHDRIVAGMRELSRQSARLLEHLQDLESDAFLGQLALRNSAER